MKKRLKGFWRGMMEIDIYERLPANNPIRQKYEAYKADQELQERGFNRENDIDTLKRTIDYLEGRITALENKRENSPSPDTMYNFDWGQINT